MGFPIEVGLGYQFEVSRPKALASTEAPISPGRSRALLNWTAHLCCQGSSWIPWNFLLMDFSVSTIILASYSEHILLNWKTDEVEMQIERSHELYIILLCAANNSPALFSILCV